MVKALMVVLIDNDKLIQMAWKLKAKNKDISLLTFSCVDHFLENAETLEKQVPIYIDSDLGNGIKGELESEKIFQMGFTNLKLCTAFEDIDIAQYPWLTERISKKAPF